MSTAHGTFDVAMTPADPELGGAVSRFEFTKTFGGDLEATGAGVMLSCGDPGSGAAGYVAIETVRGLLDGRPGAFALAQLGAMNDGTQQLRYEIVPGSGEGELAGIVGDLHLRIDEDGTHTYDLEYQV